MLPTRARRLIKLLRVRGLAWTARFLSFRIAGKAIAARMRATTHRRLAALIGPVAAKSPIVIKSTLDYHFPYDQRPHHLARALARSGHPMIFISRLSGYDQIATCQMTEEGIIITPHLDVVRDLCPAAALVLLSTDAEIDDALVSSWLGPIVYDYIDAIDDSTSSAPLSATRRLLHDRMLADEERVICVASAATLYSEVARKRSRNFALLENAVDMRHFAVQRSTDALTPEQRAVIDIGKPIAGYFGAIAAWLDYSLLITAARSMPNFTFVLIGIDFDGSGSVLDAAPENLHVLPPVPYEALPKFAVWFDVALLPFQVNDITEATSPLKLFEYMALGLPIVSTPIREAKRYASVTVAADAQQFYCAIAAARDAHTREMQRLKSLADASSNDWSARAAALVHLIDSHSRNPVRRAGVTGKPEPAAGGPRLLATSKL